MGKKSVITAEPRQGNTFHLGKKKKKHLKKQNKAMCNSLTQQIYSNTSKNEIISEVFSCLFLPDSLRGRAPKTDVSLIYKSSLCLQ